MRLTVNGAWVEEKLPNGGYRRWYEKEGWEMWENEKREYHSETGPAILNKYDKRYEPAYYLEGRRMKGEKEWREELWRRNIEKIIE